MWNARVDAIASGCRFRIYRDQRELSFRNLFRLLETDNEFTAWYTGLLAGSEFDAFFWEHPPVTETSCDRAAEFVLMDGPSLANIRFDPEPFREYFEPPADDDIATFPNLGRDAILVVPRAVGPPEAYVHLAAFVRNAPADQVRFLWRCTGRAVRENLAARPLWLSTSGMGISWLHIRIDSRPKYYQYHLYKAEGFQ